MCIPLSGFLPGYFPPFLLYVYEIHNFTFLLPVQRKAFLHQKRKLLKRKRKHCLQLALETSVPVNNYQPVVYLIYLYSVTVQSFSSLQKQYWSNMFFLYTVAGSREQIWPKETPRQLKSKPCPVFFFWSIKLFLNLITQQLVLVYPPEGLL